MLFRWVPVLFSVSLVAAEFAGPQACKPCHLATYLEQSRTHHALALRPVRGTALPAMMSLQPLAERSGIAFEYREVPSGLRVMAVQGSRSASAILEWAFGAGVQAVTPVYSAEGRYFEHRVSYYSEPEAPRRTLGHPGTASPDPAAALGMVQDPETIFRCFSCHATGVQPGPDLRAMVPGVTCERCHDAGADHAADRSPMRPAGHTREGVMRLCGSCHRLPQRTSSSPEAEDALSIRFAPVGLMASTCYRKSGTLSCITCHDPHKNLNKQSSHYDAICLECHQRQNAATCTAGQRTGCTECHMQQRSPVEYLKFTDHRIRVYRQAKGLVPRSIRR